MRFVYPFSLAILLASAALGEPPPITAAVEQQFLAPYATWRAELSEFSRADMPPSEMRVRALGAPQKDVLGAEFVAFAVDTRSVDGDWDPARMTGCVYPASSAVFVKRGAAFLAAADYFAPAAQPHPSVCGSRGAD